MSNVKNGQVIESKAAAAAGARGWGDGDGLLMSMEFSGNGRTCSSFVMMFIVQVCGHETYRDGFFTRWMLCYVNYKLLFKDTHMGFCRLVHRGDLQIHADGNGGGGEEPQPTELPLLKKRQQFLILHCPIFVGFWSFRITIRDAQTEMPLMFYYNG